jgi:hypothetical protein
MPDELPELLERVAADGARRARISAAAVRTRAARIRRRRAASAALGSAVAVAALVGGIAVAAGRGTAPITVATGPQTAAPTDTGTPLPGPPPVPSPISPEHPPTYPTSAGTDPNRASCQRPAPAGDVDGDCRPDRVSLLGDTVLVQGTLVGRLSAPVQHADPMRVAAVFDVDGDGYADVWVRVASGASTDVYALVRYDGARVQTVVDGGGRQFQAPVGATATHSDDLSCDQAGSLYLLPGTSTDGITYQGSELIYRFAGSTLELQPLPVPLLFWKPGEHPLSGVDGCGLSAR